MQTMQLVGVQPKAKLQAADAPQPHPRENEVLIRVHAAGITPTELLWEPTTKKKNGEKRAHAIPSHEFSGVIAAVGEQVKDFQIGQDVYGMNDWYQEGALAEFCVTLPSSIAPKPKCLSHVEAATVPIAALTVWQGLVERAKLKSGERVLIHGAAGAVGIFAVQLARLRGAHVIAPVSAQNIDFVRLLGAQEVFDYKTTPFETVVRDVDVVFDAVGSDTFKKSWSVIKPNGRVVAIAASAEAANDQRTKDAFFIVEPNQTQLIEMTQLLDRGSLKPMVKAVLPLFQASEAFDSPEKWNSAHGKIVVTVAAPANASAKA